MILIRRASERGITKTDWLNSLHTFSFADYYDPNFLGFGDLLVINEDTVAPSAGFGTHAHHNMEIITYVISGVIQHQDSTGQNGILTSGEIQRMSAGSGVRHSEINPSNNEPLHFLQIWIIPNKKNIPPSYEQKKINKIKNELILIGSSQTTEEAVRINQDVNLYVAFLSPLSSIAYSYEKNHYGWIQIIKGTLVLNENRLLPGDGAAIIDEDKINIECKEEAEFLLFDFAKTLT